NSGWTLRTGDQWSTSTRATLKPNRSLAKLSATLRARVVVSSRRQTIENVKSGFTTEISTPQGKVSIERIVDPRFGASLHLQIDRGAGMGVPDLFGPQVRAEPLDVASLPVEISVYDETGDKLTAASLDSDSTLALRGANGP